MRLFVEVESANRGLGDMVDEIPAIEASLRDRISFLEEELSWMR